MKHSKQIGEFVSFFKKKTFNLGIVTNKKIELT